MNLKGRRQSANIEVADPKKTKQVDPQPYLAGRTRMPFEIPIDITDRRPRGSYNKGGMVKGRDYAKKC